jgi:hypothetical protein
MLSRLSIALLFAVFLSVAFAPSARAVNCDVNACISTCQKKCATPACMCPQNCMQTIEKRKKGGQCK